jgi:hypothetical protein
MTEHLELDQRHVVRLFCLFFFLPFFQRFFSNTPLIVRFQNLDPPFGAIAIGVKLTHLGASTIGTKVGIHVAIDDDVAETLAPSLAPRAV